MKRVGQTSEWRVLFEAEGDALILFGDQMWFDPEFMADSKNEIVFITGLRLIINT